MSVQVSVSCRSVSVDIVLCQQLFPTNAIYSCSFFICSSSCSFPAFKSIKKHAIFLFSVEENESDIIVIMKQRESIESKHNFTIKFRFGLFLCFESFTCDNWLGTLKTYQNVFDESNIGACLQISYTFPQNRNENAPNFRLKWNK